MLHGYTIYMKTKKIHSWKTAIPICKRPYEGKINIKMSMEGEQEQR